MNLVSIIVVMVPSLIYGWNSILQDLSALNSVIIIHHLIGLIVAAISIAIVVSWGNRYPPDWDRRGKIGKGCLGERRTGKALMRMTMILWIASFFLGVLMSGENLIHP